MIRASPFLPVEIFLDIPEHNLENSLTWLFLDLFLHGGLQDYSEKIFVMEIL